MHWNGTMGRRVLIRAGGAAVLAASLAGCDLFSTDPASEGEGTRPAGKGKEAPELAELVAAGSLPPVEERLPENPLVVEPLEQIGMYGGTWRTTSLELNPQNHVNTMAGYDGPVRWTTEYTGAAGTEEIVSNLAKSFDVNDDGTEFTFHLRRGVKWSDGQPFTADDIVFAVEDVFGNDELYPGAFIVFSAGGERARASKVNDDYTVRISFAQPAGLFLQRLATPDGNRLVSFPRHYLEQFHPKYNPGVAQLLAEEDADEWTDLFWQKAGSSGWNWQNPDKPTIYAWQLANRNAEGQRIVLERNPYYWKIDPEGSQLPYIDRVTFELLNLDVMLLKALSGDINLEIAAGTRFTTPANKPVLARDQEAGNYHFVDVVDARMNVMNIYLNLTHADPVKREIFQNRHFRVGLSHALDRQEIINATLQRQGDPYQAAPVPESAFYDEKFAKQFTEFDIDLANEYLDKAFPDKNDDDMRLGPDGNPISFILEFAIGFRVEWVDMLELIAEYWRAVGVEVQLKGEDRSLQSTRERANEHDAGVWWGDGGMDVLLEPRSYLPTRRYNPDFGILWSNWYYGIEPNEEPPEVPMGQLALYDQINATIDADEQGRLMTQILDISKQQFYVIGTVRETGKYFLAANYFHNIPNPVIQGFNYATPGPTRTEQYFISE